MKEFPAANVVLGGFPCPGFSEAGPRLIDDERNFLYLHFIRCLMQVQPEIFVGENVKGMMTLGKGEVFKQIVEDFAAAGYTLYVKLLNARDYGVPQIRERVLIVGVRNDIDFEYKFPEPTHGEGLKPFVTLEEAIGDLKEEPGPYYEGSYSTIFMSRNRKSVGMNKVLRFRRQEDKPPSIQVVLQWKKWKQISGYFPMVKKIIEDFLLKKLNEFKHSQIGTIFR